MPRIIFASSHLGNVPAEAEIVAYYPTTGAQQRKFAHDAMVFRVAKVPDEFRTCHALDTEIHLIAPNMVRYWIEKWHERWPQGMECDFGFFDRPLIRMSEKRRQAIGNATMGLDYYRWMEYEPGKVVQQNGEIARVIDSSMRNGRKYDVSLVYHSWWGKRDAETENCDVPFRRKVATPTTYKTGMVVWADSSSRILTSEVTSEDGGKTWSTSTS